MPSEASAQNAGSAVARLRIAEPRAPFRNAEQAWFWTMATLAARRGGQPVAGPQASQADEILKCLDALYRRRRIDLLHARILRIWGERQMAPKAARLSEKSDWRIWREAIGRLEWPLRVRGIVREASCHSRNIVLGAAQGLR